MIWNGSNVVREWEQNVAGVMSVSATYLMGPSGPMYRRPSTAADVRWYVYDGLGSVVGEVDVNGTLIAEKKHDVYGLRRGNVGTQASRHGFVGSLGHYSDDETGLIYMRARYYDPAIGRFISEDPANDGSNWFAYCKNNPVNLADRNGKIAFDAFAVLLNEYYEAISLARSFIKIASDYHQEALRCWAKAEQIEADTGGSMAGLAAARGLFAMGDAFEESAKHNAGEAVKQIGRASQIVLKGIIDIMNYE